MSKKSTIEVFQTKISRNDRFAQMSHQEKLIEQKKKEIQAKLEQKQKAATTDHSARSTSSMVTGSSCASAKQAKSPVKQQVKKAFNFNTFSSDGTFMKQFKQLKEKKHHDYKESKQKMFKWDNHDRYNSEDRSRSKWKREGLLKDGGGSRVMQKVRTTRFSDKPSQSFEPKINISSSYSSLISQSQSNYDGQSMVQDVTGQPLLKNLVAQNVQFPLSPQNSTIIAAAPLLLNVPPPQISSLQGQMVLQPPQQQQTMEIVDLCPTTTTTTVITTVTLPPLQGQTTDNGGSAIITVPPPCMPPTIELSSIPPPNPIQVHNIPPPEPLNTLTIPPPAPLQVQNIPPPSPIHLNEIPNPKPLDILSIPTPSEPMDGGSGGGGGGSGKTSMVEHRNPPDFIKNIPPPNKSVPPPNLNDQISSIVGQTKPVVQQQQQQQQPPPPPPSTTSIPTCLPPPNIMPPTSMPPPQNILLAQQQQPQNILLGQQPPQQYMQLQSLLPPPSQLVNMQPSLLAAQSILSPPPSIGIVPPPPINMNCPPPALQQTGPMQVPPPPPPPPPPVQSAFITQMPPTMLTATATNNGQLFQLIESQTITDVNSPVFPSGSADYEAMASLGRMVAQCGQGIEDIVRQRKNQDPSLWFLFHKESAAYQQYLQMVEQFKSEMVATTTTTTVLDTSDDYRPEDIYEPEMPSDVGDLLMMTTTVTTTTTTTVVDDSRQHHHQGSKRRRKSRWGNNEELSLPSTGSVDLPPQPKKGGSNKAPRFSTKVTRNDPALIQYAVNAFGSTNLSEEEWCKAEDHFKINLLYQDMIRKRQEVERLQKTGLNKYEYDSDEETEGGTWEHKLREKEMVATQLWANELTRQAEGKHHIGDFLPPEEFKKFMEKSEAARDGRHVDISDYKEFKLKEDNIGFKMLQKLGWSEGQGLGSEGSGILEPVNKGCLRDSNQGLGLDQAENIATNDDEYDAYRKRMMLAYRFRPNPLNNPRRPYY